MWAVERLVVALVVPPAVESCRRCRWAATAPPASSARCSSPSRPRRPTLSLPLSLRRPPPSPPLQAPAAACCTPPPAPRQVGCLPACLLLLLGRMWAVERLVAVLVVLAELLTWPPRRWPATATPRLLHTLLLSLPAPPPNPVPAPLPPPPPLPSPAGSGGGVLHPASGAAAGARQPAAAARADVGSWAPRCGLGGAASR